MRINGICDAIFNVFGHQWNYNHFNREWLMILEMLCWSVNAQTTHLIQSLCNKHWLQRDLNQTFKIHYINCEESTLHWYWKAWPFSAKLLLPYTLQGLQCIADYYLFLLNPLWSLGLNPKVLAQPFLSLPFFPQTNTPTACNGSLKSEEAEIIESA